jgi:hypothetical protein
MFHGGGDRVSYSVARRIPGILNFVIGSLSSYASFAATLFSSFATFVSLAVKLFSNR